MRAPLKTLASLALSTLALAGPPAVTTRTYSGPGSGSAPCNTTLQACLDGAASGDTVEIATATLIDEELTFNKSLTVRSKAGVHGAIGSAGASHRTLALADAATPLTVTLSGLDLTTSKIQSTLTMVSGHVLNIDHCTVGDKIYLQFSKPITLNLSHDVLIGFAEGASIDMEDTTSTDGTILNVDSTEIYNTQSQASYDALYYYSQTGTGSFNAHLTNNVIHDTAGCACGGSQVLYFGTNSTGPASHLYMVNNTIDGIVGDAAAIYLRAPTAGLLTAYVYNNAISNIPVGYNFPSASAHLAVHADYNNFFMATGSTLGGYTSGNAAHDTAVDPKFISRASHDYRLQSTSTLLNSGLASYATDGDFYGYTRVSEGAVDKGAIERNVDLAVSASANPSMPAVGTDVTLTIAVENVGPYDTAQASASISLPAGLVYKSATVPGGSCGGTSTLLCTLGALPRAAASNITVVATVQEAGAQTVNASVSGGSWTDPEADNDATTLTVGGESSPADGGTRSDAGTKSDGGTDDGGNRGGCGCTSTSAEVPLLFGFLALVGLVRRRTGASRGS